MQSSISKTPKAIILQIFRIPSMGLIHVINKLLLEVATGDFPGGPMIKTPLSQYRGTGSILCRGTKIPHATWSKNMTARLM